MPSPRPTRNTRETWNAGGPWSVNGRRERGGEPGRRRGASAPSIQPRKTRNDAEGKRRAVRVFCVCRGYPDSACGALSVGGGAVSLASAEARQRRSDSTTEHTEGHRRAVGRRGGARPEPSVFSVASG